MGDSSSHRSFFLDKNGFARHVKVEKKTSPLEQLSPSCDCWYQLDIESDTSTSQNYLRDFSRLSLSFCDVLSNWTFKPVRGT